MEPDKNRFNSEAELQNALSVVWSEWSKDRDPANLTVEYLTELLDTRCLDPMWAVWIASHLELLDEYGQAQDDAAAMVMFLVFFANWKKSVADRWGARVENYRETTSMGGGGGGGGGSGGTGGSDRNRSGPTTHLPTIGEPISFRDAAAADNQARIEASARPEEDDEEKPLPWSEAKHEILIQSDFEREAVTAVTELQSDAETNAARKVQSNGPLLIAIWRSEPGACPKCEPLHGSRPNVWRKVAPNGPPYHPRCRCSLTWVAIEDT